MTNSTKCFVGILLFLSSNSAYCITKPTVKCHVVSEDSKITNFNPWVLNVESQTGNKSYETTAEVGGLTVHLIYDFADSGRLATMVYAGKNHILTSSFPLLPAGQLSRLYFYAPIDSQGAVLSNPPKFDVQCFN